MSNSLKCALHDIASDVCESANTIIDILSFEGEYVFDSSDLL